MKFEINRNLFLACMGLVISGDDSYDHHDADLSHLAGRIRAAGFSSDARSWFAQARTGQVAVNPYWPRGSQLAAACFFISGQYHFDLPSYAAFLRASGAPPDPLGAADFDGWIRGFPRFLRLLDAHPVTPRLWDDYCCIIQERCPLWRSMAEASDQAAQRFFGRSAPEMVFSPNLFRPAIADFVHIGYRVITIAAWPDAETMLHETLHMAFGRYRETIAAFAQSHGLGGLADQDKMLRLGYMADGSAQAAARALEDCFVRALSAVLSKAGEERLAFHVHSGFTGVPLIASYIRRIQPTVKSLDTLIKAVFSHTAANRI